MAVLLVVAFHGGLVDVLPGGWVGVDLFFCLSGFLITRLLMESGDHLWRFYFSRLRRLLPALLLMLAGVAALEAARGRSLTLLPVLFYRSNFALIDGGLSPVLNHTWSLAQEEQFYVVWPVLLVLVLRRHARLALLTMLVLIALTVVYVVVLTGTNPDRIYFGPDTHMLPLLLGCALALAPVPQSRTLALAGAVGIAIVALSSMTTDYTSVFTIAAFGAAGLVAGSECLAILRCRPLQLAGFYSYGIYLWHWPLVVEMGQPVALPASIALAVASYHLVELPIRRMRPPRLHPSVQALYTRRRLIQSISNAPGV